MRERHLVRRRRGFWLLPLLAAVAIGLGIGGPPLYRIALAGAGFKARILCSGLFVSKREEGAILAEDLGGERYRLLRFFGHAVDREPPRVRVSLLGLAEQTAIFRQGLGCTLVLGTREAALRDEARGLTTAVAPSAGLPWPDGKRVVLASLGPGADAAKLAAAVEAAFAEPDPDHLRRTRALVVVHGGRIVAERYAPGFAADMPLIGWSMTKTATNALTGVLAARGALSLDDTALRPEWRGQGDPRRAISLDHLLRMSSGLAFSEDYDSVLSDVTQMLFVQGDKAHFAAAKPLKHPPGTRWQYSSGTSVILAGILRQEFSDQGAYFRFAHEALFAPLGMSSAVFEADAAGAFVGSSLLYASARDWARLGLLFLRDGMWKGVRLLPEGWVAYSLTPAPHASQGQYGAHVWLKLPGPGGGEPPMPEDAYYMLGHDGQIVAVVPSRDLVIVRLGLTRDPSAWSHAAALAPIVAAFPAKP